MSDSEESRRRAARLSLAALDVPVRDRVKRVTRLACRLFDLPLAAVTFSESARSWLRQEQGETLPATPPELAAWADAVSDDDRVLVIPDAQADPRFADNELVKSQLMIRFYAGAAIKAPDGSRAGTLFVVDRKPREGMSDEDQKALLDLSRIIENELGLLQLSRANIDLVSELDLTQRRTQIDAMTQLWNKAGILDALARELARGQREQHTVAVIVADIDHFKKINDTHGHLVGDAVLREAATRLRESVRPYDAIGRYGGEEFVVVASVTQISGGVAVAERIRSHMAAKAIRHQELTIPVTLSLGVSVVDPGVKATPNDLIGQADAALYEAKQGGRNRVCAAAGRVDP